MENATKALMIAGAVLLAIAIISVGMAIYNSGKDTIDQGMRGLDQATISAFNSDYEGYEGTQKGSKIKSLITAVINNNIANKEDNPEKVITLNNYTESADLTSYRTTIKTGQEYIVTLDYAKSGLINNITVAPVETSETK